MPQQRVLTRGDSAMCVWCSPRPRPPPGGWCRAPSGRAGAGTAAPAHAARCMRAARQAAGPRSAGRARARGHAHVQQRAARQELVHEHVRLAGRDRAQELHRVRVVHLLQHVQLRPAAPCERAPRRAPAARPRAPRVCREAAFASRARSALFRQPGAVCRSRARRRLAHVTVRRRAAWATLAQSSSGGRRTAAHVKQVSHHGARRA